LPAAVIVPAAGRGERLGPGDPKALRDVGGVPLLVHAVRGLWESGEVDLVVVAAPPGRSADVDALLRAAVRGLSLVVVDGGDSRQASVGAALAALPPECDVVLVHDAARAFAPADVTARVVAAVRAGAEAVVPVVAVADTVKQVRGDVVEATVDRSRLRAVQTPQGFRRDVLERAHAAGYGTAGATDDASLVEALGVPVTVVDGSEEAFKVTRPIDLLLAETLLRRRADSSRGRRHDR
jgi:2-C-methyl-D-erythritol 4-phosphate cytidylyltransferase